MKKTIIIISSAIFLFFIIFLYFYFVSFKEVNIDGNKFKAEIASSDSAKIKGLSGRKNLCEKCAMLFIFEHPGKYSFWMKDMQLSLDIIWILDNKIVYVANNVPSDFKKSIQPSVLANKVLEINGGIAEKYGLKIGNGVKY